MQISYHYCEDADVKFAFTTRDEYATYREDWKARYAAQILNIRQAKEAFKLAHRKFSIESKGERFWPILASDEEMSRYKALRPVHGEMETARSSLKMAKQGATDLLAERGDSKVEAGRQRDLRLQHKPVYVVAAS